MPAETRGIENTALQFNETDGAKAKLPKCARRMEKVEMRDKVRRGNGSRHREAIFEKGPIEGFAIEGDEYGPVGEARSELVKERVLFGEIAHEELFDLQASAIPPGNTNQEWIGTSAAGQPRGFRVEKEPLGRIFQSQARAVIHLRVATAG